MSFLQSLTPSTRPLLLAPMVDASELAWRILAKTPRQGLILQNIITFTPMINAKMYSAAKSSCKAWFDLESGEEGSAEILGQWGVSDRPLIAQFCANCPQQLLASALKLQHRCDAIDLNLGCPQGIAKKGNYGAFLQEDWPLVHSLINTLHTSPLLKIPVTAKFRRLETVEKTVKYAQMLEKAGAQMLTLHGRLREQKGQLSGLADWDHIKAVKQSVNVPVISNGNILYAEDIERCFEETGVDGVMAAEGHLYNPALFCTDNNTAQHLPVVDLAKRYIEICASLKTRPVGGGVKSHIFKILKPALDVEKHLDIRNRIGAVDGIDGLNAYTAILNDLEKRIQEDRLASTETYDLNIDRTTGYKNVPYWLSQPYIRVLPPPQPVIEAVKWTKIAVLGCSFGKACGNMPASTCPHLACISHCRMANTLAAGLTDDGKGNIGRGCEHHESKVLARQEKKKVVRDIRARRKRERDNFEDSELLGPHRRRIGMGPVIQPIESAS